MYTGFVYYLVKNVYDIVSPPHHVLADPKSITVFSFYVNFGSQGIRQNSLQKWYEN